MRNRESNEFQKESLTAWRYARNTAIVGASFAIPIALHHRIHYEKLYGYSAMYVAKQVAPIGLAIGFFAGAGLGAVYSKAINMMKSKSDDSLVEPKRVNKLK